MPADCNSINWTYQLSDDQLSLEEAGVSCQEKYGADAKLAEPKLDREITLIKKCKNKNISSGLRYRIGMKPCSEPSRLAAPLSNPTKCKKFITKQLRNSNAATGSGCKAYALLTSSRPQVVKVGCDEKMRYICERPPQPEGTNDVAVVVGCVAATCAFICIMVGLMCVCRKYFGEDDGSGTDDDDEYQRSQASIRYRRRRQKISRYRDHNAVVNGGSGGGVSIGGGGVSG